MSKTIRKYDKRDNLVYYRYPDGLEIWWEFDENNNLIHTKDSEGLREVWCKYDELNKRIKITEQEYKNIKYNKKIKEYNSRTKCSRFELMEI